MYLLSLNIDKDKDFFLFGSVKDWAGFEVEQRNKTAINIYMKRPAKIFSQFPKQFLAEFIVLYIQILWHQKQLRFSFLKQCQTNIRNNLRYYPLCETLEIIEPTNKGKSLKYTNFQSRKEKWVK